MANRERQDAKMAESRPKDVEKTARPHEEAHRERSIRIRVKNRRQMFLDSNPSYFDDADLELAGQYSTPNYHIRLTQP